jgi:predicted chitinase
MSIDLIQLRKVMPNLTPFKASLYLPHLNSAMQEFDITSRLRVAAFLAQVAHESAELHYWEEIASGSAYEGREYLGNTHPGDGRRYKGRGALEITGRANYRAAGAALNLPLEEHPEMVATLEVGFRASGWFWKVKGLNPLADKGDFRRITKIINGGYNGWNSRLVYYKRALVAIDPWPATVECHVIIDDTALPDSSATLSKGSVMVKAREACTAAGYRIVEASAGRMVLLDRKKSNHVVHLFIHDDDTGWVELRELPGRVEWDSHTHTARLTPA